jgi:ubiquinone/menaquinone biosynthesis C-methylase UbiE
MLYDAPHKHINTIGLYNTSFGRDHYEELAETRAWRPATELFNACSPFLPSAHPHQRLLDVGIGSGLSAAPFKKASYIITGVDGSTTMANNCRQKGIHDIHITNLETESLPFDSTTFDVTISNATLYMLRYACKTVKEMIRVTKPKGLLAFNFRMALNGRLFEECSNPTGIPLLADERIKASITTYSHSRDAMRSILTSGGMDILAEQHYQHYRNAQAMNANPFCQFVARKSI